MEDTKAIAFFQGVLSKTREGRVRWQATADESEYIAAIGGQFTLSVSEYRERNANIINSSTVYALALKTKMAES
jgi:hypothetical protein